MAKDLNALWDWIPKLVRRIERLESGALLENSSITGGRMRFIASILRLDSGARLELVGELDAEGPWSFKGKGKISGDVDLTGSLAVLAGGRIRVGNITLDPSSNGGSVKFSGGPEVYAAGTTLSLYSGALSGGFIDLGPGFARVNGGGARYLELTPTAFRFVGIPAKTGTGLTPGLPWIDPDGTIYRIAS